jgi:hypothetical protein
MSLHLGDCLPGRYNINFGIENGGVEVATVRTVIGHVIVFMLSTYSIARIN